MSTSEPLPGNKLLRLSGVMSRYIQYITTHIYIAYIHVRMYEQTEAFQKLLFRKWTGKTVYPLKS
jgi:hypothetical protein